MYVDFSFKTDKTTLDKINLPKGLSLNDIDKNYVRIDSENMACFIRKQDMEKIKTEFDYFNSLSDRIRYSVLNDKIPYSSVPEFCSYLKNKCINTLKQFLSDKTDNIISLRIIVKAIAEQPLYLVEALQQYSDTLPENDKYYFRHDLIYGKKIREARDKFTEFKKSLEKEIRLLSRSDTDKLKKLYSGLFYFTEQFISDLKQHQLEFKFLDSPLFEVFFKEIIYFKSYYQSEFGEFHFPEILEIEKKINTTLIDEQKSTKQQTETEVKEENTFLNVVDWAIIFYYLNEAGEFNSLKKSKAKLFDYFISENNIKGDKGRLTTTDYFKKKYHWTCNRINGKENNEGRRVFESSNPPLPPDRIKKILPFIKKNKKAAENANNDMDLLQNEIDNFKDNGYYQ